MRITRRTSGGRGEYEISQPTPQGVTPNDLLGREIILRFPSQVQVRTGTRLTAQGGKRRLRRIPGRGVMQVQKQLASILLLPEPVREDVAFGVGEPVLQRRRYGIEHINVGRATLRRNNTAVLDVEGVILRNGSVMAEELPLSHRLEQISAVWASAGQFPADIAGLLQQHEAAVRGGAPVSRAIQSLVAKLQVFVSERSGDIGIAYSHQTDVLPALAESLDIEVAEPVTKPSEVDPDEVDIQRRTVREWKRWANAPAPRSARFRHEVRRAYRATCVVCGGRFPPTKYSAPGVDAAHILPWSEYDLDEVFNGLCLCKLHHWAFDESLIAIVHENGAYAVELPARVEQRLVAVDPDFSVPTLKRDVGRIERDRLPRARAHWPRPQLLEMLNASLPEWT